MPFINLVFVDAKTARNLNKKYRGQNKVATVLSFNYRQTGQARQAEKQFEQLDDCFGEIVICLSAAKKQNLSIEELVIHGLRNLLSQIPTTTLERPGQN